jgi:Family of unknown function (DUF6030)
LRTLFSVSLVVAMFGASAHAQDAFSNPSNLCAALSSEGLATEGWKASRASPGEWLCMTTLVPFGSPGSNGMPNNIAYYVNGTSRERVGDVRIKVNINNPRERAQAHWRLEVATATLFKAISQPVPSEFRAALTALKPASVTADFGKMELIEEPGRIDSFKVVITPAAALRASEAVKSAAAGDFDKCKSAVSRAAGYDASILVGDGKPTQEAGYKSFMLSGRGRDMFFCEVHGGSRYKVKAALNGKFPFRYIAEGSF